MLPRECKRLAEVDFPIVVVSKHAAWEDSIHHGHASTLHLWWARRSLAACHSLGLNSGELRLIEVKSLADPSGIILLIPNERRVSEDRRDCYWLYMVTNCATGPMLQAPIKTPACFPWYEVTKVRHYWLKVDAMTRPMVVREDEGVHRVHRETGE